MVYLLEFERFIGDPTNPRGRAKFYMGYCQDSRFGTRIREHAKGRGAAITRAAKEQGISFTCVLTIAHGTRELEQKLKGLKSHKRVLQKYGRGHYLS